MGVPVLLGPADPADEGTCAYRSPLRVLAG
jgi:hypothetical protein